MGVLVFFIFRVFSRHFGFVVDRENWGENANVPPTARTNIQPRVTWVKLNADWIRAGGVVELN